MNLFPNDPSANDDDLVVDDMDPLSKDHDPSITIDDESYVDLIKSEENIVDLIKTEEPEFELVKSLETIAKKPKIRVRSWFQRKRIKRNGMRLECDLCGAKTQFPAQMIAHMNLYHMKYPKMIKCNMCDDSFVTYYRLIYHKRKVHEVGEFNCDQCDAKFDNRHYLVRHVKKHKKNRFCELCGEFFDDRDFISHMRVKNHVYPYSCNVEGCSKKFTTEIRRGRHLFDESKLESFINLTLFLSDVHQRDHHGVISEDNIQCSECDKFFPSDQKLKRHFNRIHRSEKIQCPVEGCPYIANRKEYLKMHFGNKHKNEDKATIEMYWEQIKQLKGNFY